jgi:hypothetical protein
MSMMTLEVGLELQVGQTPNFDNFVPTAGDDKGSSEVGRETHARDPISVAIITDGVFALSKSVPQLQLVVAGTGNNLAVVSAEGDTGDITSVSNKAAGSLAAIEVPEAERSVPRAGQSELSIRANDNVLNKVRVADQGFTRNSSNTGSTSGIAVTVDVPVDNGLVSGGSENGVASILRASNCRHPVAVSLEGSEVFEMTTS